jgi:SAM-dependent methyltransferase
MIIHKLIAHHLKHKDDRVFYRMQAEDAIDWIQKVGGKVGAGVSALDLGCGHGIFGAALAERGCNVTFSDEKNYLAPELSGVKFEPLDLEKERISKIGRFDLIICSNVLEHLSDPKRLLEMIPEALNPGGSFYLSWTNWLSLWGGHEFSPYHYLGARRGHLFFDRIKKVKRLHTPYENLFPTYIGEILRDLRRIPGIKIAAAAPRYYPEFKWILSIPGLREFVTWNCAVLLQKTAG